VSISARKNDEDGRLESTFNLVSQGGLRILAFNKQELLGLARQSDRLCSYCDVWGAQQSAYKHGVSASLAGTESNHDM